MKKNKIHLLKVLRLLSIIILSLFPLFLNAQDFDIRTYSTNLDGMSNLESVISNVREYSLKIPEQMPGWPQSMTVPSYYAPSGVSLVDINGDGILEIISGSTDGSLLYGIVWEKNFRVGPNLM